MVGGMSVAVEVSSVRMATAEEIPRIVEMGRRFRSESSYNEHLPENVEKMTKLAMHLLSKDGLLVLEREGQIIGMLGFIIHSHFISGETLAGEVFWWVEPEFRGDGLKLVEETKRLARLAGAKFLDMVAPNKRVARLYDCLGYQWLESTHRIAL
jgi:GNAT superfamily N-acetyltransferase